MEKSVDIFRDTPVRLLGYANEVGEAFRPVIHVKWVRLSYGVASAYVLADTFHKARNASMAPQSVGFGEGSNKAAVLAVAADTLIWQAFASVIIPGFTINRLCAGSKYALKKMTKLPKKMQKWITTAIGLACIPFIVKPIDKMVDVAVDHTVRKIIPLPKNE